MKILVRLIIAFWLGSTPAIAEDLMTSPFLVGVPAPPDATGKGESLTRSIFIQCVMTQRMSELALACHLRGQDWQTAMASSVGKWNHCVAEQARVSQDYFNRLVEWQVQVILNGSPPDANPARCHALSGSQVLDDLDHLASSWAALEKD